MKNYFAQRIVEYELYDACEDICEDLVKIDWDDKTIIFNVESWGQLSPEEMVKKACEVTDSYLDELTKLLK